MKRFISLILALLLTAFTLVSCADKPDGPDDVTTTADAAAASSDTPESEAVTNGLPPELSYKGETIVFVSRDSDFVRDEVSVEENDGDIIHAAIAKRNADMEERFGIIIKNEKLTGDNYVVTNAVKKALNTNLHTYDIVANSCYSTIMSTGDGILYNLEKLKYLDLTAPYWSQGFNDAASIGKGQYMCTGAASLALYRLMFVTFFNRDLLTTWGEKSLFDVVNDGEWTLDYQIRLGKQYYSDNDGSSSVTKGDTVGMISSTLSYIDPYWSSCKNPILTKTDDNWYDYSIDVDRLSTTLRKVTELFYDANSYIVTSGSDSERLNEIGQMFAGGTAATATLRLCASETEYLRDMKDKYGVIPCPKLDKDQDDYYTFLHDQFTAFGICRPVDEERAEMLGAVLEYMAWSSYINVVPVYYNVALKSKYMQDSASWEMLDKIYSGIYIDAGVLYTKVLSSVHQLPRKIVTDQVDTTASRFKQMKAPVEASLKRLQESIRTLQEAGS